MSGRSPASGLPVVNMSIKLTQSHNPGSPLIQRQRERNVERHPIPDQIQRIYKIRVPTQFPKCVPSITCSSTPARASATAAIPESPNFATIASICASVVAAGIGTPSTAVTDMASIAMPRYAVFCESDGPTALNKRNRSSADRSRNDSSRPNSSRTLRGIGAPLRASTAVVIRRAAAEWRKTRAAASRSSHPSNCLHSPT